MVDPPGVRAITAPNSIFKTAKSESAKLCITSVRGRNAELTSTSAGCAPSCAGDGQGGASVPIKLMRTTRTLSKAIEEIKTRYPRIFPVTRAHHIAR